MSPLSPRMFRRARGFARGALWALLLSAIGCQTPAAPPLIIAHRGASGYRPEHTLQAYELAIEMGADYIEPDLVPTQDGVLIVRHENELSSTTDVALRFPSRKTTKVIDRQVKEGFFAEDFTLAEIKTLRAKEALKFRSHDYDGQFAVPTFAEVLALAKKKSDELGRPIGVYPELKHPTYFASVGLHPDALLLSDLRQVGWQGRSDPVFIQSFEPSALRALRSQTELRLIQLLDEAAQQPYDFVNAGDPRTFGDLVKPAGLDDIAGYADGIGVHKELLLPLGPGGHVTQATSVLADAHQRALQVHAYTFRQEVVFVPPDFDFDVVTEVGAYLSMGVDGVFCDFPDLCRQAREAHVAAGK